MNVFRLFSATLLLLHFSEASTFSLPSSRKNLSQIRSCVRTSPHCRTNDAKKEFYSAKDTALNLFGGAFVSSAATPAIPTIGGIIGAIDIFYRNYPALSAVATCSFKGCLADIIAQKRNRDESGKAKQKFSIRRNFAYIVYGGLFLGLMCEIMYNHVYPILFGKGSKTSVILAKVAFDNFIAAPLVWLPPIYFVKAILYGKSLKSGGEQFIEDATKNGLLTAYWKVWIPVQSVNFWLVPPHLRVAVMAAVSFGWMIILSCLSSNKKTSAEA